MKRIVSLILTAVMALSMLMTTAAAQEEPYEFTIMVNFGESQAPELDDLWIANIEETLNIKLNFITPAASAYDEALQIMLASGEYVDLVLYPTASNNSYLEGVRNGLYIAINDLLADCPNLMAYTNDAAFNELKIMKDDQIYGVPRCTVVRADGYPIRTDWLENLGIELPENGVADDRRTV